MKSSPNFPGLRRPYSRHCKSTLTAFFLATVVVSGTGFAPHAAWAQDGDATPTAQPVSGDPTVDVVSGGGRGQGRINYAAGVVKATGYGAPPAQADSPVQAKLMARGAAMADALRMLAMTVSAVQVTATTRVKNYLVKNDEVETHISALLQSPQVVSDTTQPDGTAVIVVALPMYGKDSIAAAVLPEVLPPANASNPTYAMAPPIARAVVVGGGGFGAGADADGNFAGPPTPATRIEPAPVASVDTLPWKERGREPGLTPFSDSGPFTSVIVDCRGLNIEAIMSPKLMDTTGREVYGTVHVSPDYAIETGIVGYPRSMRDALHTARAGGHPLIVRGLRAADPHRFNPIISLEDADRILAANNRDHFLEQTRVVFLVDPVR